MKKMKRTAVALLIVLPFLTATSFALEYFEVSKPSIKKATVYVTADETSNLTNQFVSQLQQMLERSLLFESVSSRGDADYSVTLANRVESKDLLVTIEGEKQSTYKTKYFGIRFRNTDDEYLGRKTAQMANRIIKEFFGIEGSIGSTIAWSVTEGSRKVIYKKEFGIEDAKEQVTYNFYTNYGVSWNPSKDFILYTSHTDRGTVMNVQQVNPLVYKSAEVYKEMGQASSPIWAPDGTIYLTLHISDQNSDIFQFQLEGTLGDSETLSLKRIRKMTHIPSIETEPALSPDNKTMAFVSDQTSEPQIYTLDLATMETTRITRKGGYNVSPAFSPNGRYLVYRGLREGISAIYRYDLDTGTEKQLTSSRILAEEPSWSPDGSLIVFTGRISKTGYSKIYYMLASGGDFKRLTTAASDVVETSPSWGPALK